MKNHEKIWTIQIREIQELDGSGISLNGASMEIPSNIISLHY